MQLMNSSAMQHLILSFLFALILFLNSMEVQAQIGHIYISDAGNFDKPPWQILKFNEDGSGGEVFIDTHLAWPQDVLFLEDQGLVLISNLSSGMINKHDAETGAYEGVFASEIKGPTRMKVGPDGTLYVLQWSGNGTVLRYSLDGTPLGVFTETGVSQSIGLDWDRNGDLYVSSYDSATVQRFDSKGKNLGIFVDSDLKGPTNIWFDETGDLLVVDYKGGNVKRFDSSGKFLSEFIASTKAAEGVQILPDGNLLLGNGGSSSIRLYGSDGSYIRNLVDSAAIGLKTPNAVILRKQDTLVIRPGSDLITGARVEPYTNKWKLSLVHGADSIIPRGVWTDKGTIQELNDLRYLHREQKIYDTNMQLLDTWLNTVELKTMKPIIYSTTRANGKHARYQFTNSEVISFSVQDSVHSDTIITRTSLNGQVYDWNLYGMLLAGLQLRPGVVAKLPYFDISTNTSQWLVVRDAGSETLKIGKRSTETRRIETDQQLTFWISRSAPYVIKLELRKQNNSKLVWEIL